MVDGRALGVVAGLVRGAFLVDRVYAQAAREYGITAQQGQLMCVLMGGPVGMGELGRMLGLAKSSLSGLVDRCEKHGLVARAGDAVDSRLVAVGLTVAGDELVGAFYAETCRRVEQLTHGLGEGDRKALATLLGKIVEENDVPEVFLEQN